MSVLDSIRKKLKLPASSAASGDKNFQNVEKVIVFVFGFIIALGSWMLVNLERSFTMQINIPLEYADFPGEKAPTMPLPSQVTASITGEGWKLLNFYGGTPAMRINIEEEEYIDVGQTVRTQLMSISDIIVNRVDPSTVRISLDERIEKRVPIELNANLEFRQQHRLVSQPVVSPDSVTVTGARSLIESLTSWPTVQSSFTDLHNPLETQLRLQDLGPLIQKDIDSITLNVPVAEFTEGETRVPVEIVEDITGISANISPNFITIRYDIPIHQYSEAQQRDLFEAVVLLSEINEDYTGYINPTIRQLQDDFSIRIRSITPRRLSHFIIVDE